MNIEKIMLESRIARLSGRVGRGNSAIINKLKRRLRKLG